MSAASAGSVSVSSATTSRPARRALSREGTIALESLGVIISPFAPAEIKLSTAATWDSLSPSFLPANDCRSPPSAFALASAPSFIFTKNGFVSVLVIRPTLNAPPPPPPPLLDEPLLPLSLPHATAPAPRASAAARTTTRLPLPANECPIISLLLHLERHGRSENVYFTAFNRCGAGLSSPMKTIRASGAGPTRRFAG